jgi:cytochrome c
MSRLLRRGGKKREAALAPLSGFFSAGCAAVMCVAVVAGMAAQAPKQNAKGGAPASVAGNPVENGEGKKVYDQRCASCHFNESTAKKIGPGLKGVYARGRFADGKRVDDASMTVWIEKGGKDMPDFGDVLKPHEVRALIAYLKTL